MLARTQRELAHVCVWQNWYTDADLSESTHRLTDCRTVFATLVPARRASTEPRVQTQFPELFDPEDRRHRLRRHRIDRPTNDFRPCCQSTARSISLDCRPCA